MIVISCQPIVTVEITPFNFAQIVFTYILVHSILIHTTADEIVKSYIDRYIFSRPGDYLFEML